MTTQDLSVSTTVASDSDATAGHPGAIRVSLREIYEIAYRSLVAHGASHGEARIAARMVLEAELMDAGGLAALIADLGHVPWTRTPVSLVTGTPRDHGDSQHDDVWTLGSSSVNRLLRDGPLAIELVAGGDAGAAGVSCEVAGPGLLDPVMLDLAQLGGKDVSVAVVAGATERGDAVVQLRRARSDGSIGVSSVERPPQWWSEMLDGGSGVLALSHLDPADDASLTWSSADDRAAVRKRVAAEGLAIDARLWANAYGASRRYLVPD